MVQTLSAYIDYDIDERISCHHTINFQDAANLKNLEDNSIDLIVTSPPYWAIKDYGNENQLGFNDSLPDYMKKITGIFSECIKSSNLVVNCVLI